MTRYKHFAAGVSSAYGLLAANIVFTLAGVPLALHYLSKEEFGLWAFVVQIVGLLQLLEIGVSGAFSRVIIDHKDEKEGGSYARTCAAAWILLTIQGLLIILGGVVIGLFFGTSLGIDDSLARRFSLLLISQCLVIGISFAFRIFTLLFFAHHRTAFTNYCQIGGLAFGLLLQWWFFHLGLGLVGLPLSAAVSLVFYAAVTYVGSRRAGFLPRRWIRPTRSEFEAVIKFGLSIFLIHIGGQFIWAGQVLILTKAMGLETAAVWAVCTKPFVLICQISWRPIDLAFTFFAEMSARGEATQLWKRYRDVAGITLATSAIGAVGYAACNSGFVRIWAQGRIAWPPLNDILLACWMIPLSLTRCGNIMIQATKDLRILKFVFIAEALTFLTAGYAAARFHGIAAMIGVFIVCTTVLTAAYTFWRVARYFEVSLPSLAKALLAPVIPIAALGGAGVLLVLWLLPELDPRWKLALEVLAVFAGSAVALRFAMSDELKSTIIQKLPARLAGLAALAIGARPAGV